MTYESLLNRLKHWDLDECLFRDAYFMKKNLFPQNEFFEKYSSDTENLEIALHPESIDTFLNEERFIAPGRTVAILKHPRYTPLFFHEHAFFELVYVLSGNYTQHFPDQTVHLKRGDLCLLAPNVKHGIEVFDESIVINILIRRSTFIDIFINTIRDKTPISDFFTDNLYAKKRLRYMLFHTKSDFVIRNYILDMYLEQLQFDDYSDRIICSLMTIFFNQLIRRHQQTIVIPEIQTSAKEFGNTIINYMMNHYQGISIQQIAEHFHYSRQYCSKLIKESSGYSFSELLTSIRLQQGMLLLTNTTFSISTISEKLGYENPETFIRIFKKNHHMTPGQYRKQHTDFTFDQ